MTVNLLGFHFIAIKETHSSFDASSQSVYSLVVNQNCIPLWLDTCVYCEKAKPSTWAHIRLHILTQVRKILKITE